MNEMIGEKTATLPEAAVLRITKLSLQTTKKSPPRAIPFMLLTIASRQMFTAHVVADRRGDGVFAVMSLGNWTAQEPNKTTE